VKIGMVVLGGVARAPEDGWVPCLHWLIERLARRHEVHVFSIMGARRPERYPLLGAHVHHPGVLARRARTFYSIVAEHRRGRFDVLHAFWAVPAGYVAALAAAVTRRPLLLHLAGGELVDLGDIKYGGRSRWQGRVAVRAALAAADKITAASAGMVDACRRLGFVAERVPLGVDLRRWPAASARPRSHGEPARLIHVASLNRVKDQPTLLRAARRLADQGIEFRLDIVGGDTLGGKMQALAQELALTEQVRFHGYVSHERLHPLVSNAHLLLLSSLHEAGPLALLEAGVVGVPTVGTAVGHTAEWSPLAAVAVPPRDPEALAAATRSLLLDDERRLALGREAQRRALGCDADWTAQRFESLYHELISLARLAA
jgi:glycosyltransferase involved in cell wall biosynthesis